MHESECFVILRRKTRDKVIFWAKFKFACRVLVFMLNFCCDSKWNNAK